MRPQTSTSENGVVFLAGVSWAAGGVLVPPRPPSPDPQTPPGRVGLVITHSSPPQLPGQREWSGRPSWKGHGKLKSLGRMGVRTRSVGSAPAVPGAEGRHQQALSPQRCLVKVAFQPVLPSELIHEQVLQILRKALESKPVGGGGGKHCQPPRAEGPGTLPGAVFERLNFSLARPQRGLGRAPAPVPG